MGQRFRGGNFFYQPMMSQEGGLACEEVGKTGAALPREQRAAIVVEGCITQVARSMILLLTD